VNAVSVTDVVVTSNSNARCTKGALTAGNILVTCDCTVSSTLAGSSCDVYVELIGARPGVSYGYYKV
jgi:hypothetical protein